jgi:tetratricopeptide (TPR) repeat protein
VLLLLSAPILAAQAPAPAEVAQLYAALQAAPNEAAAGMVEAQLRSAWAARVSPTAALLLNRAAREQTGGSTADAMDDYGAAIDLDPDSTETWNRRARARFAAGDLAGAVRDEEEVLRRDPRNFAALQDLSHVAEARSDWRAALLAWQKVLDLDPQTPGGQARLKDLRRRAYGEEM